MMPVYSYACPVCGSVQDEVRAMDERNFHINCDKCGADMDRVFTAPAISGDLPATGWRQRCVGYDEGLDEVVLSATHRKEIMKRKGLREYEPDPQMKKSRDEMKYVKKHAGSGKEAADACKKLGAEAARERRQSHIKKAVRDGLKDI